MPMISLLRRTFITALAVGAIAACSGGDAAITENDLSKMAIGDAAAPVKLVEYASITCGACAQFHRDVVPTLKEMIEDGRVQFEFREFPTAPAEVAIAGFAIARCAADGDGSVYFEVLEDMFENQQGILAATRNGTVKTALQAVGARHGIDETAFDACLSNEDVRGSISKAAEFGTVEGVTGTPTLFLNGRQLTAGEGRTAESIAELVNAIAPPAAER